MRVIALVGSSGTGKSHKALKLAHENNIESIIDDGLLIMDNKVVAGKSAKKERTAIAAVKRALFLHPEHRKEVVDKIKSVEPESILILGTSERMVKQIAERLEVGQIHEIKLINEVATPDEIMKARKLRTTQGKHVIPVPTFEIKKEFSGYFLNPLKIFQRKKDGSDYYITEKSVVRPTFSYLGKYLISDRAIVQIIKYSTKDVKELHKIININILTYPNGIVLNIDVILEFGSMIIDVIKLLQNIIKKEIEGMTSLNILSINIDVKSLNVNRDKMFTR